MIADPIAYVTSGSTDCAGNTAANSNWCTSESQIINLSSVWNIKNAHFRLKPLDYIESSEFCSSDGSIRWRMCLDAVPSTGMNSTVYVSAYLKMECDTPVRAEYEISIPFKRCSQNQLITWKISSSEFTKVVDKKGRVSFFGLDDFYSILRGIPKYNNDTLTLSCKIKAIKALNNISGNTVVENLTLPACIDINLMHEGKYSDVVLVVGHREINAHKVMLASHSPVFRAMFDSNMQESSTNRVVITDLDCEVVDEMIHFIYTGQSPKLRTLADRLLGAAEKYGLANLRVMCEEVLCASLTVENAFKMMIIADLYNANKLKTQVARFVCNNMGNVMESADWKDMVKQQSFKHG